MDTGYRVVHESESYLVICSEVSDAVEVIEKATDRVIVPSARQVQHLESCWDELARIHPTSSGGPDPLSVLLEDFASAVFHNGQHLERAFFKLSPKSRACSALARAGINGMVARESQDPTAE